MNGRVRDWLLECPGVRAISTLALDAAAAHLLDLPGEMARAIAEGVRRIASGRRTILQSDEVHARQAYLMSTRPRGWRLTVAADTIVLTGSVARNVGISQGRRSAALHIRTRIPETAVAALAGRRLQDIVSIAAVPLDRYLVREARQDDSGLTIWFDVPRTRITDVLAGCRHPVPVAGIRRARRRIGVGSSSTARTAVPGTR